MRSKKQAMIEQIKFLPRPWHIFFNPYYLVRRALYLEIDRLARRMNGVLVDIGCGTKPYECLFDVELYVGIEVRSSGHSEERKKASLIYDGIALPFKEDSIDSVFASEVFEHVAELDGLLTEVHRVLKPDGMMLITVPMCWNEHELPYDYRRFTLPGIVRILSKNGFVIIDAKKTNNFVLTLTQGLCAYLYQNISTKFYIRRVAIPILIAPISITGLLLSYLLPTDTSLYSNNVVLARKGAI